MTENEKLALLAQTIEADPEDMKPETVLDSLDYWDSLSKVSVLAMFTAKFKRSLSPEIIKNFKTVGDILQEMNP